MAGGLEESTGRVYDHVPAAEELAELEAELHSIEAEISLGHLACHLACLRFRTVSCRMLGTSGGSRWIRCTAR